MNWPRAFRRRSGPRSTTAAADDKVEFTFQTYLGVSFDNVSEVTALRHHRWSMEEIAERRPDLLFPQIILESGMLRDSELLSDARPPLPGEIPVAMTVGRGGRPFSFPVQVLEDVDIWVRPAPDPETAHVMLRSRKVTSTVEGTLFVLHTGRDAHAIEQIRSRGYDLHPTFEITVDIAAWHVAVWRDLVKARRWVLCYLSCKGKSVALLAINGANVVVEV